MKSRLVILFLCAVIILSGAIPIFGQMPFLYDYLQITYNDDNGLSTREANTVVQTSDGYIWVGSYSGLLRYDGSSFTSIFSQELGAKTFAVRTLFEDSSARLWIGTNDKGVFLYEEGIISSSESIRAIVSSPVRCITEDGLGNVYIGSAKGLACYRRDGTCYAVSIPGDVSTVISLSVDQNNLLWGVNTAGQLFACENGKYLFHYEAAELASAAPLTVYAEDSGPVIVGTEGSDILFFQGTGNKKQAYQLEHSAIDGVETVNAIYKDRQENLWFCADTGLGLIQPEGDTSLLEGVEFYGFFNSIIQDYEGNYWISSTREGVLKFARSKFFDSNYSTGLSGVTINATAVYNDTIFAATDEGLLAYDMEFNPLSHPLTEFLEGTRVRSLTTDHQGRLWICTYKTYGVVIYDGNTISYINEDSGLIGNKTRQVLELSDGRFAVATGNGVSIIENGRVVQNVGVQEGLTTQVVLCLLQRSDGKLFAGTDGGGIFEITESGAKVWKAADEKQGFGVVLRMVEDKENECLWVGGSTLFIIKDGQLLPANASCQSGGSVFDIKIIDEGMLIMKSNLVAVVNRKGLIAGTAVPRIFDKSSGLKGDITSNSWHAIDRGLLYISTGDGIYVLDTVNRYVNMVPPKVKVNAVLADDFSFPCPKQEILIEQDNRSITIDFAALSYTCEGCSVEYWLEGFDLAPITVAQGEIIKARYTNLEGGEYYFHLRAINSDGIASEADYTLTVDKELSIFEQPWFDFIAILLLIAAIAGVAWIVFQRKTKKLIARQAEYRNITRQALNTIAEVVDAKDQYTHGHSHRVAIFASRIYGAMGADASDCENIYFAGLLHDIGKIGVPDYVLNKPDRLTDEEYQIMKGHPGIGSKILRDFTGIPGVIEGTESHHERPDGKGYPKGVKAEEISLFAKIIGVADAWDAMSTDRVYRPRLSQEVIIDELRKGSGSQFDSQIAEAAIGLIQDGFDADKELEILFANN